MVLRSAEASEVQQALAGPVEHDAHAIQQIDDARRIVAHVLDRGLVGEEVAPIHCVVQVLMGRIAFTFRVHRTVDPALRADRMAALDGHEREQVYGDARFRNLHRRHQPSQSAADDDDLGLRVARNCRHSLVPLI